MLKEIHEQADAGADTISDRTARGDGVDLDEEGALDEEILAGIEQVVAIEARGYMLGAPLAYALGAGLDGPAALALAARCGAVCLTGRGPYGRQLSRGELDGGLDGDQ